MEASTSALTTPAQKAFPSTLLRAFVDKSSPGKVQGASLFRYRIVSYRCSIPAMRFWGGELGADRNVYHCIVYLSVGILNATAQW